MSEKDESRSRVEKLITEYRSFAASHNEADVNEEQTKISFIVPLLEALGWNLRTDEILPEQRTLAGEADFGLRAFGVTPQIYVECKPFRESLDSYRMERGRQITYAEKAVQYAWSMKANWAILTNFKKLRLYYALVRKPYEGLVFPEIQFDEYLTRFDELWLISRSSVTSGAIESYRKKATRKYVDEAFLTDLIESRYLLLNNIQKNNASLSADEIYDAAQRILDRLIFVRSCEDRNIIASEMLWKHFTHWQEVAIDRSVRTFMMDLKNLFRDMDQVYNGKLFEPHPCEDLKIDNSILEEILERLYGDGGRSGYRFDAIPVNVLGEAYELYIGSLIKEKAGAVKSLEIIDDYKKRQEHGIYYTPSFVTHFIVKRTLGEFLVRLKEADRLLEVRLLDQAAGSGSFLIEGFDHLKIVYANFNRNYQENSLRAPLEVRLVQPEWADPEKAILSNNIYGVDLDPQAVEITTLNLELKAVKTKERIPNIAEHIQRGNSIVSSYAEELTQKFSEDELKHLLGHNWQAKWAEKHPFKFDHAFKEVMTHGGFDFVVGNPPYNNMRDRELKIEQAYCQRFHEDIFRGNSDILFYFIKSGLAVLRKGGLLGLIVARYFLQSEEADRLRRHILEHSKIRYVIDTRNTQVFGRAVNVLTAIIILERDDSPIGNKAENIIKVVNVKDHFKGSLNKLFEKIDANIDNHEWSDDWVDVFEKSQGDLSADPWVLEPPSVNRLLERIRKNTIPLGELCDIGVGFDTGLNVAKLDSQIDDANAIVHPVFVVTSQEASRLGLERGLLAKMVKGFEVQRYLIDDQDFVLINTSWKTKIDAYPQIKSYLSRFRRQLKARHKYRKGVCPWYGVGLRQNEEILGRPTKILVPKYATGNKFALDDGQGFYCTSDVYAISLKSDCSVDVRFILGILNTRMMEYYHKKTGKLKREGYYEYFAEQLKKLPIKRIDFEKQQERKSHDAIVDLVNRMVRVRRNLCMLEKAFAESAKLYSSTNVNLRTYYEYETIHPRVLEEFNRRSGTIRSMTVTKESSTIHLSIDFVLDDGENDAVSHATVIDLTIEDEDLLDFIFYSLRKFATETRRRTIGSGKIINVLLSNVYVPEYFPNKDDNTKTIRSIMERFQMARKKFLDKAVDFGELESEMAELDQLIEAETHKVYNINESEVARIDYELMPADEPIAQPAKIGS
jgi:type I restriction-modification system DNA methylase subunit